MSKKKSSFSIEISPYKETRPYVLWRRVSTKRQGESGLGLEAQLEIAKRFMQREPVEVFTDVFSGTKLLECKELAKAIACCKDNNYVLVIAKTDRWRNLEEALWLLNEIGEGNLIFCDLPECNKYILVQLVQIWARQAEMNAYNTKMALAVRAKQAEEQGGWVSRSGHFRTKLGNPKGVDTSKASFAAARKSELEALEWRRGSDGYKWIRRQVLKGKSNKEILEEFNENYDLGMKGFSTRTGCRMNPCTLSKWIAEIRAEK